MAHQVSMASYQVNSHHMEEMVYLRLEACSHVELVDPDKPPGPAGPGAPRG